ncbi:hypothetical protein NAEGRDRAFT_82124 [Naegleria gruberi]|uniref:BTB domain-containing protein n=1 Tax=Naegleria gruberi TaxID=5762 RepID=D2W2B6_NAEGR|nr:uncharacterized protein NAEGRDRAFT_82124 [Naegleria gruberi]EFC36797.1 hypothetical protein NAEGRDRAFT_82124 [Naegleria gruberi]|eukprot:XP_002669541.1 hypothetical protein NAEGRDRAFT_82124 [Naegleria gruberi strain NEG-M]
MSATSAASTSDNTKKRKTSLMMEASEATEIFENDQNEKLIDEISDALHRLSLQKQTEEMIKKLVEQKDQTSGESKKSSTFDKLAILQQMQQEEMVVLKVGGKFFYTTMKTLMGERGNSKVQTKKIIIADKVGKATAGKKRGEDEEDEEMDEGGDEEGGDEMDEDGERPKEDGISSLEYVCAQDNLFKVMFDSGFGIERDEANKSAISFPDRNPDYFEYILEHLRQGGKVKSLGIEKLNADELENILEESRYFATEKLSEYILFLLDKYHKYDSNLSNYAEIEEILNDSVQNLKKVEIPLEQIQQRLKSFEDSINESKKSVGEYSRKLVEQYQNFILGTDLESDLSVKIDVSGQIFTIPFTSLRKYENFLLSKYILSPNFGLNENGCVFIDRNPKLFALIHGYIISGGKFNHFPKNLSQEKKLQLKQEAEFYGLTTLVQEYLDPLRYPVEKIGKDNIELKEKEDKLREIFAKERESPLLNDPYLLLSPLFQNLEEIKNQEKYRIDIGHCPKLLDLTDKTRYSRQVSKPRLVNNLNGFKLNWHRFTQGALDGLDWNNVFAAGGGILGCCLKDDNFDNNTAVSTIYPTSVNERTETNTSRAVSVIDDENDENEAADFGFWRRFSKKATTKSTGEEGDEEEEEETEQKQEVISKYPIGRFHNLDSMGNSTLYSQYSSHSYASLDQRKARSSELAKTISESTTSNKENARFIPDANIPAPFKKSDIDLFLYALSEEEAEEKIKHIYQTIKKNMSRRLLMNYAGDKMEHKGYYSHLKDEEKAKCIYQDGIIRTEEGTLINDDVLVVRTKFAVTFYCYKLRPIQVVLRIYKSPAEVLLGFDIDCATMGFDGNQVWSSARARRALMYHTNLVDVDRQSTTYEYRLYKYSKRGFSVSIPGYDTAKVQNQLLQYPRRFPFTSTEYLLHGLARLIAFDNSCRAKNPKHILGVYDDRDPNAAQLREENKALILSGELNVKSDYLDLNIIKSYKYPPSFIFTTLEKTRQIVSLINLKPEEQRDIKNWRDREKIRRTFRKGESVKFDSRLKNNTNIKMERDPDWKPHFIYSLNDIDTVLNSEKFDARISNKIQFLTVDPGTQKIGSFHPKDINFYRDAYQPVPFSKLPILKEAKMRTVWFKAMTELPPQHVIDEREKHVKENTNQYGFYNDNKDYTKDPFEERYQKFSMSRPNPNSQNIYDKWVQEEIWFEAFTPEESNKIEQEFRKFIVYGNPESFAISGSELIDFSYWRLFLDSNHPTHPNTAAALHRKNFCESGHYFGGIDEDQVGTVTTLSYRSFY